MSQAEGWGPILRPVNPGCVALSTGLLLQTCITGEYSVIYVAKFKECNNIFNFAGHVSCIMVSPSVLRVWAPNVDIL